MNKMNKKGFTLIEMLVVIAIIAVLVAIIIPTVTSATDKAAAATNAANLRSIKAEVTTAYLTNDESKYTFDVDETTKEVTVGLKTGTFETVLPTAKKCGDLTDGGEAVVIAWESNEFKVTYNSKTITNFSDKAEGK